MREFREKKVVLYKISAYMRWFSILSVWLCFIIAVNDVSAQTYENYADSVDRYTGERNWHKAEEMLMKALEKEPANPSNFILLSNLGTVHRNMGKLKEALADYDNALSITPNAVAIIHNRAALLLEMDSTKRAYSDYARIKVLDKSDIDSRYYHGMIALGYGYFDIKVFSGHSREKKSHGSRRHIAYLSTRAVKANRSIGIGNRRKAFRTKKPRSSPYRKRILAKKTRGGNYRYAEIVKPQSEPDYSFNYP